MPSAMESSSARHSGREHAMPETTTGFAGLFKERCGGRSAAQGEVEAWGLDVISERVRFSAVFDAACSPTSIVASLETS